jgi:hypothetical protein
LSLTKRHSEIMRRLYGGALYTGNKPNEYDFVILLDILNALRGGPRTAYSISQETGRRNQKALRRHLQFSSDLDLLQTKGGKSQLTEKGSMLLSVLLGKTNSSDIQLSDSKKMGWITFSLPKDDVRFTYRVKFTNDMRTLVTSWGRRPVFDLQLIQSNDPTCKPGDYSLIAVQKVLFEKLFALSPLLSKTFDITNEGRPPKKSYYEYTVRRVY